MDIMELGAIGELVGGVAVIASLIFVDVPIRTSVKTMRATPTYEAEHTWACPARRPPTKGRDFERYPSAGSLGEYLSAI